MYLSLNFSYDILSNNTELTPVVIITEKLISSSGLDYIHHGFSTNNVEVFEKQILQVTQ